jgi:hypothetical protein
MIATSKKSMMQVDQIAIAKPLMVGAVATLCTIFITGWRWAPP